MNKEDKKSNEKVEWWSLGHHLSGGENTTLIPRHVVTTNIHVFAIDIDIVMMARGSRSGGSQVNASRRGSTPAVHEAILGHNLDEVKRIVKQQPDLIKSHDGEGRTPLSCAVGCGYVDIVEYLLKEFPASKTTPDKDSSHAVHRAFRKVDVLKAFYSDSPNSLLVVNKDGRTVLHLAVNSKQQDVVDYLLGLRGIAEKLRRIKDENGHLPFP